MLAVEEQSVSELVASWGVVWIYRSLFAVKEQVVVGLVGAESYRWEAVVLEQRGLECEQRFEVGGGCVEESECVRK